MCSGAPACLPPGAVRREPVLSLPSSSSVTGPRAAPATKLTLPPLPVARLSFQFRRCRTSRSSISICNSSSFSDRSRSSLSRSVSRSYLVFWRRNSFSYASAIWSSFSVLSLSSSLAARSSLLLLSRSSSADSCARLISPRKFVTDSSSWGSVWSWRCRSFRSFSRTRCFSRRLASVSSLILALFSAWSRRSSAASQGLPDDVPLDGAAGLRLLAERRVAEAAVCSAVEAAVSRPPPTACAYACSFIFFTSSSFSALDFLNSALASSSLVFSPSLSPSVSSLPFLCSTAAPACLLNSAAISSIFARIS
mmetsp:Transcript_12461/g.30288  ORF Transcript_12461/g.30288 Transcript_12461/m.30288 type:complete len:308 (+) Transcript_12461:1099-2022(+)